jgi:antitoxin MazE7
MATDTTTIRVPISTRDRLAAQARQRGISMAALLEELSEQAERQAAFEAERMATLADAEMSDVQDEDLDWDATAGDGIQ